MKRKQQGQSLMEYVIVCGAIALALSGDLLSERSVFLQVVDAFGTAYQRLAFALSLPE
jgi:hypothetical protein